MGRIFLNSPTSRDSDNKTGARPGGRAPWAAPMNRMRLTFQGALLDQNPTRARRPPARARPGARGRGPSAPA
eukprot:382404-Pyramimonas_sp.AAC.1